MHIVAAIYHAHVGNVSIQVMPSLRVLIRQTHTPDDTESIRGTRINMKHTRFSLGGLELIMNCFRLTLQLKTETGKPDTNTHTQPGLMLPHLNLIFSCAQPKASHSRVMQSTTMLKDSI